jgi:hypothetical protein
MRSRVAEIDQDTDPEDLREVIGAYHRAVAEIVAGFDGFVAKYMGDGCRAGGPGGAGLDRCCRPPRNLLAQVWLLSGRPRRLKGNYQGWENLARAVVGDLTGKTSASKPSWYRNACTDLWGPIEQNRVYPRGFADWLKRVSA